MKPRTGLTFWTEGAVGDLRRRALRARKTQIIAYEMIAALEGIVRFAGQISNREVILFVDNLSAKGSLAKGRCRKNDLQAIVDEFVNVCVRFKIRPRILWIPSSLNISDLPSRKKDPCVGKRVQIKNGCVRSCSGSGIDLITMSVVRERNDPRRDDVGFIVLSEIRSLNELSERSQTRLAEACKGRGPWLTVREVRLTQFSVPFLAAKLAVFFY